MATLMNRVMISIPPDLEKDIQKLKRTEFYDKPYSELYRKAIRLGLDKMAEQCSTDNEDHT